MFKKEKKHVCMHDIICYKQEIDDLLINFKKFSH
jgi:hypothetical protein